MVATATAAVPLIAEYGKAGAAAASSIGYVIGAALGWLFFARLARRPS